jgi:methyl-accepting chemotaxis protein
MKLNPFDTILKKLCVIFGAIAAASALLIVAVAVTTRDVEDARRFQASAEVASRTVARIDGLLYAVTMDTRGMWMAANPKAVETFAAGQNAFIDKLNSELSQWRPKLGAEQQATFDQLAPLLEELGKHRREVARVAVSEGVAIARPMSDNETHRRSRQALNAAMQAATQLFANQDSRHGEAVEAAQRRQAMAVYLLSFLVFAMTSSSGGNFGRAPAQANRAGGAGGCRGAHGYRGAG